MSKKLYIVRHAKASKEEANLKDWERPLIEIGVERAGKVAKALRGKKIYPNKIISSHAFRALNTAVIFAATLGYPVSEIDISHDIYRKDPEDILDLIKKQEDSTDTLMLFGHNPEFTDLYNLLTGEMLENMPTSAVACIQFDTEKWSKIQPKKGKCTLLETGK